MFFFTNTAERPFCDLIFYATDSCSTRCAEFQLDPLTLTLLLYDCLGQGSGYSDVIYRFNVDLDSELVSGDFCYLKNALLIFFCLGSTYIPRIQLIVNQIDCSFLKLRNGDPCWNYIKKPENTSKLQSYINIHTCSH